MVSYDKPAEPSPDLDEGVSEPMADDEFKVEKGGENDASSGPVANRGCTDIQCTLVWIVHIFAFVMLWMMAMMNGNITRLTGMRDFKGHNCGLESNFSPWLEDEGFATTYYDMPNHSYMFYSLNTTAFFDKDQGAGGGLTKLACGGLVEAVVTSSEFTAGGISGGDFTSYCSGVSGTDNPADLTKFTDMSAVAANLQGDNGGDNMLLELPSYFNPSCVMNCDVLNAHANAGGSNNGRSAQLVPDKDSKQYKIMNLFWTMVNESGQSVAAAALVTAAAVPIAALTMKALPLSECPYADARFCIPAPGLAYTDVLGATCMPKLASAATGAMSAAAVAAADAEADSASSEAGSGSFFDDAIKDVGNAMDTVIIVLIMALVIGFVFMVILRFAVGFMVWGSIMMVMALFAGAGLFMMLSANKCANGETVADCPAATTQGYQETDSTRDMYTYGSYFFFGVAAIYALFILCMCKRIQLGIAINKVAATFISHHKQIIFAPVVQVIVVATWMLFWLVAAAFILSTIKVADSPGSAYTYEIAYGTDDTPGECTQGAPAGGVWKDVITNAACVQPSANNAHPSSLKCWRCWLPRVTLDYRFWFAFFSYLWNNALIVALGQIIVAGSVGVWYFTANDKKGTVPAIRPAVRNALRFHFGSACMGSFILAVVQLLKWYCYFLQKQAESAKNKVMEQIAKIVKYCLACLERCIKFLNKNAYIQIALLGKNFCVSAWNAFMLIVRNMGRIAALAGIGAIVGAIGMVFITVGTGILGYFTLVAMHPDDLKAPAFVTFLFFVIGYIIAKLFMTVFALAVDASLQCFILDEEINGKDKDNGNTPPQLKAFL